MSSRLRFIALLSLSLPVLAAGEARSSPVWTSIGPDGGGGMTTLVASPSSPSVLYAGTQVSGVQVSRDGGRSWRPAGVLPDYEVQGLAVDPRRPNTVFAATAAGLSRSLDGGRSWSQCGTVPGLTGRVAVHPRNPALVYAGGTQGLFLSLNRCASFRRLPGFPAPGLQVYSLALDPFIPNRVYVSADFPDSARDGVYVSADGGFTWARRLAARAGALLADPGARGAVYLATEGGFYRSTNQGQTWRQGLTRSLHPFLLTAVPGPVPRICVVSSSSVTVLCSRDQGRSFQEVENLPGGLVQALAGGGQGSLVVGRFDGEIVRSPDGGVHWEESGRGFVASRVNALAVGPGYLLAGGDGLFRSSDGGATWSAMQAANRPTLEFPSVFDLEVDPGDDGRTAYAIGFLSADSSHDLWRSTDSGLTWTALPIAPGVVHPSSLAIDPAHPGTLYLGVIAGDGGVWKSTDGGDSWRSLPLAGGPDSVGRVAVAPDGSAVYAVTSQGIERSRDGGATWQRVHGTTNFYHIPIVVAPGAPRYVYTDGFSSRDGGDTWVPSPNPPGFQAQDLAVDPLDPETVYAAAFGVWRKVGNGEWEPFGSGLINPNVRTVVFDPENPERLLCGTGGSGAYETIVE